jgi:hypothetical protein
MIGAPIFCLNGTTWWLGLEPIRNVRLSPVKNGHENTIFGRKAERIFKASFPLLNKKDREQATIS